jgi:mannose-6-phosphate isomerase-like protein (cupin superfamily)
VKPIVVTDTPKRTVSIRLASEQLVVTETRYQAGERGPDLHVHHHHADCFYVLEGALTLSLDDSERTVGPESFVFVPPDVVHTFRNDGPGELRFFNLHAPGMGFERYLQGLYDGRDQPFDQHPPPTGGGRDSSLVLVRSGQTMEAVEVSGNRISFLAEADETGGVLGAIEFRAPRSFAGPPVHLHRTFHDIVIVREGTIEISLGDELEKAGVDALFHAAPGTTHTFSNPTDEPLRFLNIYAPAGFERFFRERAASPDTELTSRYDWEAA